MDRTPGKEKLHWSLARVAFFAAKAEVEAAMAEGYALTLIHAKLGDRLPMCYSAFARLVQRYIKGELPASGAAARQQQAAPAATARPRPARPAAAAGNAPSKPVRWPGEPISYNTRPVEELRG